jgi:serine/threonine protein kinase
MNYLHHSGVIHLDLTPNNVLVTENYEAKVGDFGLSKVMSSAASVTNRGGGTVVYTVRLAMMNVTPWRSIDRSHGGYL